MDKTQDFARCAALAWKRIDKAARLTAGCMLMATLFSAGSASAALIGGIEFPDGAASFADAVVSFTPGPNTVAPYNDPSKALGVPDYDGDYANPEDATYVSLGWGGQLVLRFTDNSLTTSGDSALDLWIFEIGPAVEPMLVHISADGLSWISVGSVGGATSGVDIDAFIDSGVVEGAQYSYVRLTDSNQRLSGHPWAGADIDAVGAISSAPPVPDDPSEAPEPGTLALLGAALVGVWARRRRSCRR